MILRNIRFCLLSCVLTTLLNVAPPAWALEARPILWIAVGETKQPYVLSEQKSGVEVDLITAILSLAGYQARLLFVPNKRAQMMLQLGAVDAAISSSGEFLSEPYIAYQNMAITLCNMNIRLQSVADLARYRVAAFQNAHLYLGDGFAKAVAGNKNYREISPQIAINRLLYARQIDVGISDMNIFKSLGEQAGAKRAARPELCPYQMFPPTLYRLAFRRSDVRDQFNRALSQALQGDIYESVAARYRLPLLGGHPYFKPKPSAAKAK